MHSPEQHDVRVRETIDGLTSSSVPAPLFASLITAGNERRAGISQARVFASAAAIVIVIGIAAVVALVARGPDPSSSAACADALRIGETLYEHDAFSDGRLAVADLGAVIGRVDHELACEAGAPDPQQRGIAAFGVPVGSAVHAVMMNSVDQVVAAVTADGVRVFRVPGTNPLDFPAEVAAIGINSEVDGRIRFATIADRDVIDELLSAARSAPPAGPATDGGLRFLVLFERDDGLVDVAPFVADDNQLGDRTVDGRWATAIERALAAAPGPAPIDGVTLSGARGTAAFHRFGACRHDHPDLTVEPGENLTAMLDPDLEAYWTVNTPIPTVPGAVSESQVGRTVIVPRFEGTIIVDVFVVTTDGAAAIDACTTLASP